MSRNLIALAKKRTKRKQKHDYQKLSQGSNPDLDPGDATPTFEKNANF